MMMVRARSTSLFPSRYRFFSFSSSVPPIFLLFGFLGFLFAFAAFINLHFPYFMSSRFSSFLDIVLTLKTTKWEFYGIWALLVILPRHGHVIFSDIF